MINLLEAARVWCGIIGAVLVTAVLLTHQTATAVLLALFAAGSAIAFLDVMSFLVERRAARLHKPDQPC